jgi:hypothetical protein
MCNKILSFVGATVVMAVLLAIALPEMGHAGQPPSPPILDKLPPTWSQKIPGDQRFEVVLDGEAALDKETGLVWQLSTDPSDYTWQFSHDVCYDVDTGGRTGWQLPTIEQMMSLIDRNGDESFLPAGHPFDEVRFPGRYWTATPSPSQQDYAYYVDFNFGAFAENIYGFHFHVWCVRGGQSNAAR